MKVSQFNLKIFLEEMDSLCEQIPQLKEAAETWMKYQKQRETYGSADQYYTQRARAKLEAELIGIRQKMAMVYDFMGDRGLVEFTPTGWSQGDERITISDI